MERDVPAAESCSCVMNLAVTITIPMIAAVALVASNIICRRPVELGQVRLLPYDGIRFLSIVTMLVALAHHISILFGRPLVIRIGLQPERNVPSVHAHHRLPDVDAQS